MHRKTVKKRRGTLENKLGGSRIKIEELRSYKQLEMGLASSLSEYSCKDVGCECRENPNYHIERAEDYDRQIRELVTSRHVYSRQIKEHNIQLGMRHRRGGRRTKYKKINRK